MTTTVELSKLLTEEELLIIYIALSKAYPDSAKKIMLKLLCNLPI